MDNESKMPQMLMFTSYFYFMYLFWNGKMLIRSFSYDFTNVILTDVYEPLLFDLEKDVTSAIFNLSFAIILN